MKYSLKTLSCNSKRKIANTQQFQERELTFRRVYFLPPINVPRCSLSKEMSLNLSLNSTTDIWKEGTILLT